MLASFHTPVNTLLVKPKDTQNPLKLKSLFHALPYSTLLIHQLVTSRYTFINLLQPLQTFIQTLSNKRCASNSASLPKKLSNKPHIRTFVVSPANRPPRLELPAAFALKFHGRPEEKESARAESCARGRRMFQREQGTNETEARGGRDARRGLSSTKGPDGELTKVTEPKAALLPGDNARGGWRSRCCHAPSLGFIFTAERAEEATTTTTTTTEEKDPRRGSARDSKGLAGTGTG